LQSVELLSAYISYAREKIQPVLGDIAAKDLVDSYVGTNFCLVFLVDYLPLSMSFFKIKKTIIIT